jgi:uncharacterized protein (DUF2267 family)
MSRQEFFRHVAERAHVDVPKAVHEARCVMEVVGQATEGGLTDKVRKSIDEELASVLFAGSQGHV